MIDSYESLQWNRKLYEVGDVEMHISLGKPGAETLANGAIIFLDAKRAAQIVTVTRDEQKGGAAVSVKARELKGIVADRVSVPTAEDDAKHFGYDRFPVADATAGTAALEAVIKHYVDKHMVNPEQAYRKIPRLIIAPDQGRGEQARWSSRFENLDAVFKSIGESYGMGYEVTLDLENKRFVFDVIDNVDASAENPEAAVPVTFASGFGNIASVKHTKDDNSYKNAVYAGGSGETENQFVLNVYEGDVTPSGFARKESFIDCGNIGAPEDLLFEARHKMKAHRRVETLTGTTVMNGPFQYMRDWDIGYRVTIASARLGVQASTYITEAKEVYERGKYTVTPTFGPRGKNILDEIRAQGVMRLGVGTITVL
jgi:hypothetical protein